MKRTTTTREYDEQGRVTKEVVTEETEPITWAPTWTVCSCPSTYCPLHQRPLTWWQAPVYSITTATATIDHGVLTTPAS